MKQIITVTLGFGIIVLGIPALGQSADQCPPELTQAKAALKSAQASLTKAPQVAKGQEIQAPRSPKASARAQDIPMSEVRNIAAKYDYNGFPVVTAEGRLVGMVTKGDLLRVACAALDDAQVWRQPVSRNDLMVAIAPDAA